MAKGLIAAIYPLFPRVGGAARDSVYLAITTLGLASNSVAFLLP